MKSRIKLAVAAIVILASVLMTACGGQGASGAQTGRVTRGNIVQSVSADGELSLPQQRMLSFGVNGKIQEVRVEEGDKVTRGQVLARLETASLERALKTAELAVKSAEADRQQAEAGVQSARADLAQAQYGIKSAAADLKQADLGVQTAQANLVQAELGVKSAESDLAQATDNFQKITYPYTYSTFALDIPEALNSITTAERQVGDALKAMQAGGLTTDQYAQASQQLKDALDNLFTARQRLGRGQGADVFASGILTVKDFWTLRAAQLGVDKAQLGVDTANGALNIAQLAVDTANSVLDKAKLSSGVAGVTVDKAQASLDSAQGVLGKARLAVDKAGYDRDTAQKTLEDATITAPFEGIIASVNVKTGDILTAADYTRAIFDLVDLRQMELKIKVDEMDVPGVQTGQEATISIDALPDLKPRGKVMFVSPVPIVEGGVVEYQVKVAFSVPEGSALKSGMSSTGSIVTGQRSNVLLVPSQAVARSKSGKPTVDVLVGGRAETRAVETGVSDGSQTEILSGLNEGDQVVFQK